MEPRGKHADIIGTREGEGSGLVTCRDTCSIRARIWATSQYPVPSPLPARPQREKSSGVRPPLMTPVAVRLYVRRTSDLAQTPDLHSVQLRWICRRPHPQVRTKIAGSPRKPHRCISLSFIVETGPEVLNRICEDAVGGGNIAQHRFVDCSRELGSRSVPKLRNCYSPFIRFSWFLFGVSYIEPL
jgi:hypothetical protein